MPSSRTPRLVSGLLTDVGVQRVGGVNQDAAMTVELPTGGLFAVADGMGGHAAGELAANIALETLAQHYTANVKRNHPPECLTEAIQEANTAVVRHAVGEAVGMGTTLLAALIDGGALLMAHVGDSRAYLLRKGELKQLTEDHSWVAEQVRMGFLTADEAHNHQWKNVVSNALGGEQRVRLEIFGMPLQAGDRLLLCSDGLSGVVEANELRRYLLRADTPEVVTQLLIDAANEGGGPDNITAVVIDVCKDAKLPRYKLPVPNNNGPEYADVLLSTQRGHSVSAYVLLTTVYFTLLGIVLLQKHWLIILYLGTFTIVVLLVVNLIKARGKFPSTEALSVRKTNPSILQDGTAQTTTTPTLDATLDDQPAQCRQDQQDDEKDLMVVTPPVVSDGGGMSGDVVHNGVTSDNTYKNAESTVIVPSDHSDQPDNSAYTSPSSFESGSLDVVAPVPDIGHDQSPPSLQSSQFAPPPLDDVPAPVPTVSTTTTPTDDPSQKDQSQNVVRTTSATSKKRRSDRSDRSDSHTNQNTTLPNILAPNRK